jgi:Family of unknown function (DUF5320)
MPGGDRTGSMGLGPRTGRGLGYCSGFDSPGYVKGAGGWMGRSFGFGRGMGRGCGFGNRMGWGRGFAYGFGFGASNPGFAPGYPWMQPMSKDDEIKLLKSQADALSQSQKYIEKRLGELEKEKE